MEFFRVMAQVWSKYSHLFLHGLWMTVYMGLLTVAISTVFGSILALLRRSNWGIGPFKPIQWIVTAYVEVIRGTPILLQLYFFYFMLPNWLPFLELTEFSCPDCGKPLVRRKGQYGEFFGCIGYPGCKQSFKMKSDGTPDFTEKEAKK